MRQLLLSSVSIAALITADDAYAQHGFTYPAGMNQNTIIRTEPQEQQLYTALIGAFRADGLLPSNYQVLPLNFNPPPGMTGLDGMAVAPGITDIYIDPTTRSGTQNAGEIAFSEAHEIAHTTDDTVLTGNNEEATMLGSAAEYHADQLAVEVTGDPQSAINEISKWVTDATALEGGDVEMGNVDESDVTHGTPFERAAWIQSDFCPSCTLPSNLLDYAYVIPADGPNMTVVDGVAEAVPTTAIIIDGTIPTVTQLNTEEGASGDELGSHGQQLDGGGGVYTGRHGSGGGDGDGGLGDGGKGDGDGSGGGIGDGDGDGGFGGCTLTGGGDFLGGGDGDGGDGNQC